METIITTNKNKIAIAPTYTIINIRLKKSTPKKNNIKAALIKVEIKKTIEFTGTDEKATNELVTRRLNELKKWIRNMGV